MRRLAIVAVLSLFARVALGGQPNCEPPHRIDWPAGHPVWSLCWISPDESDGVDGSGLELRDVYYKGKLVLRQAGIPLINVDYDPGGCGSYRDWQHTHMDFEAGNPVGPPGSRYAEPATAPRTVCDHPGTDGGDFQGVAAWKTAEQLELTTQIQAGPYRYIHKWTFRPDGTIEARVAFTSRFDPCNQKPHNHHAYFRLEIGISEDGRDSAEELTPQRRRFRTEVSRRNDRSGGGVWRVRSKSAQRGYEIISPPANGIADAWAVADLWVLAAHDDELDDGGAREGPNGSAVQLQRYVNGESVDRASLVLWVHAMDRHDGSVRCRFVGPALKPLGNW